MTAKALPTLALPEGQSGERVGIYGGSFDPPHRAHGQVARLALQRLALTQLLVIPTGSAWYKTRQLTAAHHRLAMCQLAFSDLPNTRVDEREIGRVGASYTVDTLRELRAERPHAAFFLIIGADQALKLPTWRDWQAIIEWVQLVVVDRPDNGVDAAPSAPARWLDVFQAHAISRFVTLDMPPMATSGTQLREQIRAHGMPSPSTISHLAPQVAGYILQHQLYKAAS